TRGRRENGAEKVESTDVEDHAAQTRRGRTGPECGGRGHIARADDGGSRWSHRQGRGPLGDMTQNWGRPQGTIDEYFATRAARPAEEGGAAVQTTHAPEAKTHPDRASRMATGSVEGRAPSQQLTRAEGAEPVQLTNAQKCKAQSEANGVRGGYVGLNSREGNRFADVEVERQRETAARDSRAMEEEVLRPLEDDEVDRALENMESLLPPTNPEHGFPENASILRKWV
ncbi:hypothetical protein B0H14DRAFT_3730667, partial [Mycena olivaceomarginata]